MAYTPSIVRSLNADTTVPATMDDPELTYYADGTLVVMVIADRPVKTGVTVGMTEGAIPYQFQAVKWDDGTTDNTAPHVLRRVHEG